MPHVRRASIVLLVVLALFRVYRCEAFSAGPPSVTCTKHTSSLKALEDATGGKQPDVRRIVASQKFQQLQTRLQSEVKPIPPSERATSTAGQSVARCLAIAVALWGPFYFGVESYMAHAAAQPAEVATQQEQQQQQQPKGAKQQPAPAALEGVDGALAAAAAAAAGPLASAKTLVQQQLQQHGGSSATAALSGAAAVLISPVVDKVVVGPVSYLAAKRKLRKMMGK